MAAQRDAAALAYVNTHGLTAGGHLAFTVLTVVATLRAVPDRYTGPVLGVAGSVPLLLLRILPWQSQWIVDATTLRHLQRWILDYGVPGYLHLAGTLILLVVFAVGGFAGPARRWLWFMAVVVLTIGLIALTIPVVGDQGFGADAPWPVSPSARRARKMGSGSSG